LFAHVCYGSQIVGKAAWSQTFPQWVSYNNVIRGYVCSGVGRERWGALVCRIADEAIRSKTASSLRHRLQAVYHSAMADLSDSFDARAGDALNLMYFQQCLDTVTVMDGSR